MGNSFIWDEQSDACTNALRLINDYIPSPFNLFLKRNHVKEATKLIEELNKIKQDQVYNNESSVYFALQTYRTFLNDDPGNFKSRLDFAVTQLEAKHPSLINQDTNGQESILLENAVPDDAAQPEFKSQNVTNTEPNKPPHVKPSHVKATQANNMTFYLGASSMILGFIVKALTSRRSISNLGSGLLIGGGALMTYSWFSIPKNIDDAGKAQDTLQDGISLSKSM